MPYDKQIWADDAEGGTPISAARLAHMEDGIEAAQSGASVSPIAVPFTTETMPNAVSGSGDMTVLVFPDYTTALAFKIDGDEFPRVIVGSDGSAGLMLGDGTYDPQATGPYLYATDGGNWVMKARAGHDIDFQADAVTQNGQPIGASVADSRLSLWGDSDGNKIVFEVFGSAGSDLTLSEDGTYVTVNTEGIYAVTWAVNNVSGALSKGLDQPNWAYDWEAPLTSGLVDTTSGVPASMSHRFGVGDTLAVNAGSTGSGGMNIVRLA